LAFLHVESRLANAVADVLKAGIAGVTGNRKHRFESGMQADLSTLVGGDVFLQELSVRLQLRFQKVRYLQDIGQLPEVIPNTLLFGERVGHRGSSPELIPVQSSGLDRGQ